MTDNNNIFNTEEEELDTTVVLTDDEGNEYPYDIADYIELEDKEYVVLVPQDEEDEEVVIMRVEQEDEETDQFLPEDDEDILQKVFDIFKERFEDDDEYEFTDAE